MAADFLQLKFCMHYHSTFSHHFSRKKGTSKQLLKLNRMLQTLSGNWIKIKLRVICTVAEKKLAVRIEFYGLEIYVLKSCPK